MRFNESDPWEGGPPPGTGPTRKLAHPNYPITMTSFIALQDSLKGHGLRLS